MINHMFRMDMIRVVGVLSIVLLLFMMTSCEEEDDGYFTPPVIFEDTTVIDTNFTVVDPCLTSGCALNTMTVDAGSEELQFEFYNSYDILDTTAVWGRIRSAIIVVHGNNRNANEYFNWMSNSVLNMKLEDEVVIISPYFKLRADAGGANDQIYWTSDGWKRGFQSTNITSDKISSYALIDSFISILNDKERFPFMEHVIVTGHSAGAQLTHLYAASNTAVYDARKIDVEYIAANSQYFFYPGDERYNENTGAFDTPTGCDGYTEWPYGVERLPSYVAQRPSDEIITQFVNNKMTYLLGTLDIFTNGTLNTTDCEAVLLGKNRFDRGNKMVEYMETFYAGVHPHQKVNVENVGHDAAAMYNSPEARALISSILKK